MADAPGRSASVAARANLVRAARRLAALAAQRRATGLDGLRQGAPVPLSGDVVVVSPHCDDAVLSLGGVLAARRRVGARSTVLTVLAGNPRSEEPAGTWDRDCGFALAGEATRTRRKEDHVACARLGAVAVHLDGTDQQYVDVLDDTALWEQAAPLLETVDEVLLPGFPLRHPDHRRVTELVLRRLDADRPVRLYAEEPYATWLRTRVPPVADPTGGAAFWSAPPVDAPDLIRGLHACAAYRSQLGPLSSYLREQPFTVRRRLLGPRPFGLLAELASSASRRGQPVTAPAPAGLLLAGLLA